MPSKMSNSQESNLYVVSFPNSLNFYAEDSPPFRQVLKIYNTYEFPIKFRGKLIKQYITGLKLFNGVCIVNKSPAFNLLFIIIF